MAKCNYHIFTFTKLHKKSLNAKKKPLFNNKVLKSETLDPRGGKITQIIQYGEIFTTAKIHL